MSIDKTHINALIDGHGSVRFLTGSNISQAVGNLAAREEWTYPCNIAQNNPYQFAIIDEILGSHFVVSKGEREKSELQSRLQQILTATEWQETMLLSSSYGFDLRENDFDWEDDRKPLIHILALRQKRSLVLWIFNDMCDPRADDLVADQELPPLPTYIPQDLSFADIEVRSGERHVPDPGAITALETEFGCAFPQGYGEYLEHFGRCALDHLVRIYLPDKVREYQEEWHKRIDEYWLWDEATSALSKDEALAGICFGDTVNGDELVFVRDHPGIYVLPRGSYAVISIGDTLPRALHWLCCSGTLVYPASKRVVFPF